MRKALLLMMVPLFIAVTARGADATAGKTAYDKSCKTCHGSDGTANPAIAKTMGVTIADLKSAEVQSMSDADLKKIITTGKGKMHAVTSLSASDVDNVIAYVRTLKK